MKEKFYLNADLCENLSYLFILCGIVLSFWKWWIGVPIWFIGLFLNLFNEWIDTKERIRVGMIQD